ncbi:hypothetical protein FM106_11060 [Brachybacterium faecium]|nr:hypothetical protein FM106_11060 [Brachybacterium faecium]
MGSRVVFWRNRGSVPGSRVSCDRADMWRTDGRARAVTRW